MSECIPSLDFRQLKRENKEEIDFIYNIKKEDYNKYVVEFLNRKEEFNG